MLTRRNMFLSLFGSLFAGSLFGKEKKTDSIIQARRDADVSIEEFKKIVEEIAEQQVRIQIRLEELKRKPKPIASCNKHVRKMAKEVRALQMADFRRRSDETAKKSIESTQYVIDKAFESYS